MEQLHDQGKRACGVHQTNISKAIWVQRMRSLQSAATPVSSVYQFMRSGGVRDMKATRLGRT